MYWTFGNFLWATIAFFFWVTVIWMFIALFADIVRRDDLSGWAKAGWIALMVLLPLIGILIYLVVATPKEPAVGAGDHAGYADADRGAATGRRPADEIAAAAELHDRGRISADEFAQLKRRALRR
ncbi:membrane protein [Pilimelia terevasa]|uniref:Membrane protein n=1 Tax=Pilimelia terevasa TaxID=53372 RepID=A0A8J3FKN8_9ACTN|nr:SHOCT domain-containing protein [Pilimelia terevasa]GGK42021.1 membrane protein [Pilimelia terevasa]